MSWGIVPPSRPAAAWTRGPCWPRWTTASDNSYPRALTAPCSTSRRCSRLPAGWERRPSRGRTARWMRLVDLSCLVRERERVRMIVAVIGKGGVGKTTIASLILRRLLESGETPVLAIDADPSNCLGHALGDHHRADTCRHARGTAQWRGPAAFDVLFRVVRSPGRGGHGGGSRVRSADHGASRG